MQSWLDVEAYNEGLQAFFCREPKANCPYPDTSARNAIWREGWEAGLSLMQHQTPTGAAARPR